MQSAHTIVDCLSESLRSLSMSVGKKQGDQIFFQIAKTIRFPLATVNDIEQPLDVAKLVTTFAVEAKKYDR